MMKRMILGLVLFHSLMACKSPSKQKDESESEVARVVRPQNYVACDQWAVKGTFKIKINALGLNTTTRVVVVNYLEALRMVYANLEDSPTTNLCDLEVKGSFRYEEVVRKCWYKFNLAPPTRSPLCF